MVGPVSTGMSTCATPPCSVSTGERRCTWAGPPAGGRRGGAAGRGRDPGNGSFRGEDEREMGFRATMRSRCPGRRQVDLVDADGRAEVLHRLVLDALAA